MDEEIQRGPFPYSLQGSLPPPSGYPAGPEPALFEAALDFIDRRLDCADFVLHGFPRYDSPYAKAPFPLERIRVECGSEWLELDWAKAERLASRLLGS